MPDSGRGSSLAITQMVSHLYDEIGPVAPVLIAAGFIALWWLERRDTHSGRLGAVIALPTLVVHSVFDAAALALRLRRGRRSRAEPNDGRDHAGRAGDHARNRRRVYTCRRREAAVPRAAFRDSRRPLAPSVALYCRIMPPGRLFDLILERSMVLLGGVVESVGDELNDVAIRERVERMLPASATLHDTFGAKQSKLL
jgi:hypothetical protein